VKRPGLTTAEHAQLGATIASGQDSVPSAFATRLHEVTDGDSFVAFMQSIHHPIFEGAFSFAGQLRRQGEQAYVDENHHTVQGTLGGPLVREHLSKMYADLGLSPKHDIPAFARWFARFLQRIFAIHPFALRHAHEHLELSDAARLVTTPRDPFKPREQY
jgi:fido (protein-threonine AMPylation protein)